MQRGDLALSWRVQSQGRSEVVAAAAAAAAAYSTPAAAAAAGGFITLSEISKVQLRFCSHEDWKGDMHWAYV